MAHELAHIVMKHGDGADYVANWKPTVSPSIVSSTAMLDVLQPADYLEISYLCGVSRSAASP
jgi:hypothetical protein